MKCPNCNNEMYIKTLLYVKTLDASGLAEWVFHYPYYEYFKKCKFLDLNNRLYILGISKEFWEKYHKLKGDRTSNEID